MKLCGHARPGQHGIVALIGLGGRDSADRLQKLPAVEPVHSFQRRKLDGFEQTPRFASMDELVLVKPVDGLCESVVVAVANAPDWRLDSGLSQPLTVSNDDVLRPPVGMMHQPATMKWPPIMEGLLQRIEHEACMSRPAGPPADNPASVRYR